MIEDKTASGVWEGSLWWCSKCNCYHVGDCLSEKEESVTDKLDKIIKILERIEKEVQS